MFHGKSKTGFFSFLWRTNVTNFKTKWLRLSQSLRPLTKQYGCEDKFQYHPISPNEFSWERHPISMYFVAITWVTFSLLSKILAFCPLGSRLVSREPRANLKAIKLSFFRSKIHGRVNFKSVLRQPYARNICILIPISLPVELYLWYVSRRMLATDEKFPGVLFEDSKRNVTQSIISISWQFI